MRMKELKRVIISGGGTGGHIFPAIAIANEIKAQFPNVVILFVGAEGKMEMEKVPAAGYEIVGLPIVGLQRKVALSNFYLPFKLLYSLLKAFLVVKKFKPQVAIGVGGYASAPTLKMATILGIPTVIQEQNSYPGKTNKWLAKKAAKICVAYEGLEQFFSKEKIAFTGNPVRSEVINNTSEKTEALAHFNLSPERKTVLIIGGSLGARTLNDALDNGLNDLVKNDIQVIWQCGKFYADSLLKKWENKLPDGVWLNPFIMEMDKAYVAADFVVSRAGALSVSELCLVNKPTILVPSPNVAEDHQTKNAMALVRQKACLLVKDSDAKTTLISTILALANNTHEQIALSENIRLMGKPNATKDIVKEILNVIK
jgi:UDP-N-acetylglucosamine--N-acetylmuramyl-(pentapeptide) pyrophosphoryl-undecaprenol N-acetylglucosamine transferase